MRDELLAAIPQKLSGLVVNLGKVTTGRIVLRSMKELLPTEDVARVALMDAVEKPPIQVPRNYKQLADALTDRAHMYQITVRVLRGQPDDQRVASILRKVVEPFRMDPGLSNLLEKLMDKSTMYTRPAAVQILAFAAEARGFALQLACDPQIGDHRSKEASARAAWASAQDSQAASEWDGTADPTEYGDYHEDEGDSSAALAVGKGKGKSKSKSKIGTTICQEFATECRMSIGRWLLVPSSQLGWEVLPLRCDHAHSEHLPKTEARPKADSSFLFYLCESISCTCTCQGTEQWHWQG